MNNVLQKTKLYFADDNRRGLFVVLLIVVAIPLTVFIAQRQQDVRQRASTNAQGGNVEIYGDSVSGTADKTTSSLNVKLHVAYNPLVSITPTPTSTNIDLSAGLLGYWRFDETSGSVVADSSLNHFNGTANINGSTTDTNSSIVDGKVNNARHFMQRSIRSGTSNDFVRVPSNSLLAGMQDLTMAFWVNPSNVGTGPLITKYDNNGTIAQYGVYLGTEHQLIIIIHGPTTLRGGADQTAFTTNPGIVPDDAWTYITVTYQGATGAVHVYLNGTSCGDSCTKTILTGRISSGASDLIFSNNDIRFENTNMSMDEIRLYNRALSEAEVQQLYQISGGQ